MEWQNVSWPTIERKVGNKVGLSSLKATAGGILYNVTEQIFSFVLSANLESLKVQDN